MRPRGSMAGLHLALTPPRDIESSEGITGDACGGGYTTEDFLVLGGISRTEVRAFPPPAAGISRKDESSSSGTHHCFLNSGKSFPLVRTVVTAFAITIREAVSIRLSELGVPCPSYFRHFNET